jgi:hypothetical protein
MPALVAGIHVFIARPVRRGWHPSSGLPELGIMKNRRDSGKPDLRDKPGHDDETVPNQPSML